MYFDDKTRYRAGLGSRVAMGAARMLDAFRSVPHRNPPAAPTGPGSTVYFDQSARAGHPACLPDNDRRDIETRGQFPSRKAIVFAQANHSNLDVRIWLEDIYGLSLINVYEATGYFEWLLKCGKDADLFVVDADSFASDQSLMLKFFDAIQSKFPGKPIILLDCNAPRNEFTRTDENGADVRLQSPTSRTAVWLGVKAAMDQHHWP